jgi:hypothetical protein
MKERIDEYDMAKKMMSILRGGYKPLLNEFINAPDLNTDQTQGSVNDNPAMGDDQNNTNNQNNNQNMAKAPSEGRESLVPLTDNYFELEKNDDRYKALVNNLTNIVPQAKVTSVYISKEGGLAINGNALTFGGSGGLFFTMMYSDDTVIVNSEEVQGKIGAEVQLSLQRFFDTLRADVANAKQYLYDPMIDKNK